MAFQLPFSIARLLETANVIRTQIRNQELLVFLVKDDLVGMGAFLSRLVRSSTTELDRGYVRIKFSVPA